MRIPFHKITNTSKSSLQMLTKQFDIVLQTYPSYTMSFDNVQINDIQSYTDDARYQLDLFELDVQRRYDKQSIALQHSELIQSAKIQVMAVHFKFDMNISFRLFQSEWTDFWRSRRDDYNIQLLQPLVECYGNTDLGYHIFKSLFSSYMLKVSNLVQTDHIMCVKHGNVLLLAYGIENSDTYYARDDILDLYLDGIYEMVKVTSGRGYFTINDNVHVNEINVVDEFGLQRRQKELVEMNNLKRHKAKSI